MSEFKIKEVTPAAFICGPGSCPSVFEIEDGRLLVIGKKVDASKARLLPEGKVGPDELVIEIPAGLVSGL